jgi:hypothetical protein
VTEVCASSFESCRVFRGFTATADDGAKYLQPQ